MSCTVARSASPGQSDSFPSFREMKDGFPGVINLVLDS